MNYYIIEDIDNPIDKYFIVQTPLDYDFVEQLISKAKEIAEENGTYDTEELEALLNSVDKDTLIIHDFSTLYV